MQIAHSDAIAPRSRPRAAGCLAAAALLAATLIPPDRAGAADDVKIGILIGQTGPVAAFAPPILDAIRLAVDEVNAGGGILDGRKLQAVVVDSKGTADGGIAAARTLIEKDGVVALVGDITTSSTLAAAEKVAVPAGVLQISPSATSPVLTRLDDHDLLFRLVPSDEYQAMVLAKLTFNQGYDRIALTYAENVYGRIVRLFRDAYTKLGGTITADVPHHPGDDYAAVAKKLAGDDAKALVVIAFPDTGIPIIKQALDGGAFETVIGTDKLLDPRLIEEVGGDKLRDSFFTAPAETAGNAAAGKFERVFGEAYGSTAGKFFVAQAYDSVMLTALAIEKAGSADRAKVAAALRRVCCGPGRLVEPGEWSRAKALVDGGSKIDYNGASGPVEFDAKGDIEGVIGWFVVENGAFKQVGLIAR
ncbi:MAG: ABC transporter substrate-binding protein [Dongiaceae bacterium]